jgi:hypothetical protein
VPSTGYSPLERETSIRDERPADPWRLSWQKAKDEAQRLVDRMQYRNTEIAGKTMTIDPVMAGCTLEGEFRAMVAQAVARILRSRGAIVDQLKRE